MNDIQSVFLQLLRCAIRKTDFDGEMNLGQGGIGAILRMADQHGVLPLVLQPMLTDGGDRFMADPESRTARKARSQTIAQAQRTADFLLLLRHLDEEGLHPLIMKGLICRNLYPVPSSRPSTDEDLLIPPDQAASYHKVLTTYGFQLERDNADIDGSDEITYIHPGFRMVIEIHKYPFPRNFKAYSHLNRWLSGVQERAEETNYRGTAVRTMEPTDHLLYMLFHVYKHFLHGGFGIRQICDIALFSEHFDASVDWERVWSACRKAGIYAFSMAVLSIAARDLLPGSCLSSHLDETILAGIDRMPLLEDILGSGIYGTSSLSRMHSSTLTLQAAELSLGGKRRRPSVLNTVFPPLDYMRGGYPYLHRAPFLLPVAWLTRLFRYLKEKRRTSKMMNSAKQSVKMGKQRVELMKYYGIIGG